ncbi:speckle-type POZ protein B [Trichonephila clavipes]|nr:speckle-type POZ protein B [Trichonephila clavipes]
MCPLNYQQKICSPSFVVGALGGTRWKLIFYPKGHSCPDYMSAYLLRETYHHKFGKITVDLEFTLICTRMKKSTKLCNVSIGEGNYHGVSNLLRIRYRNGKYIFSCKKITLICRITSRDDVSLHNSSDSLYLSNHLLLLFKSAYLADLVINCRKEEFRVHTAIIMARCPQLLDQLDFVSNTSFPRKAQIFKFDISVFKHLLKYIYTGRISVPLHNLRVKLYEAAYLLDMRDLTETMDSLPDISSINTAFSTEQCYFTWTIVKSYLLRQRSLIRILQFNIMYFHDLLITLRINPVPEGSQENLSVHFSLNSFNAEHPVFLWYKIFLKDTQGNRLYCIHRKGSFENDGTWLGNKSFDFKMLPDEFVLECQIEVSDDTYTSHVGTTIDDSSPDWELDCRYYFSTFQLSKDMKRLLESRKFSDTIIHCKDRKFSVHRAILEVRSAFFRKLFKQFEIINGRMTVNPISPYLLHCAIVYAYSGMVKITKRKNLIDLHKFAIALDMHALKQKCASCLHKEKKSIPLKRNLG